MKTILAVCTAAFCLAACSNKIAIHEPDFSENELYKEHPRNSLYIGQLQDYQNRTQSPGAILAIKKNNEPTWVGATGFSNLEHNTLMTSNTQFRTGSITKMFTAIVILRLVEEKKVSIEDFLATHLPEIIGKIPQADQITIRHLLGHLSGIVDPPNDDLQYQANIINDPIKMQHMSVDERLKKHVYRKKLKFTPGTNYSYSNTNYWLLGKIAEKIGGKDIQAIMADYIFRPLNMKDTYLESREDRNIARGYADLYNDKQLFDVSIWDRAESDGEADGGLISTATDLQKFITGLFEHRLISAVTLAEMKTIQSKSCDHPNCEYGLGLEIWRTEAGNAYGHNGGLAGIEANILYYEETGATIVLFKNNGNGSDKNFLSDLLKN